ncbi:DUF1573 domain-containing protein [Roseivirga sp. BDSF3-8]|uniref:DUF1573 domain-containing protein n=1 Tax=Roseivirga sp. BDSF3-8 TaxID=3241598 RepID=UPI0035318CA0
MGKQLKIIFLFTTISLLSGLTLYAQNNAELTLLQKSHEFGLINEADGPVEHTFYFVNTGEDSLRVKGVRASCGCTTPAWSSDPVAPADTGFITARYNPTNRPGQFNKSLTITSNALRPLQVLTISGKVIPRPRTPAEDFPTKNGDLRSRYRAFYMGTITTRGPVSKEFTLYNDGEDTIYFQPNTVVPDHIQLAFMPDTLPPSTKGKVVITYDSQKKGRFGYQTDNVVFFTSEKEAPHKSYSVMATIQEYFPPMTKEELKQAPKIGVSSRLIDYGNLIEGDTATREITISNNGLSPLEIRDITSNCGCIKGKASQTRVMPGESVKADIQFMSEGRKGSQQKMVTVFSNDPKDSAKVITIKADVELRPVPPESVDQ